MNIILGANGYIGSYFSLIYKNSLQVINDNSKIVKKDNQVYFSDFLKNWNKNLFNDSIVYMAINYDNIKDTIDLLYKYSNINQTFILFSSAVIYDNINLNSKNIYCEKDSYNFNSSDNYATIIKENEKHMLKLRGHKIILRCSTIYGFAPNFDATRGINKMIYSSLINNKLLINKNNLNKSFVSLIDLNNIINCILEKNRLYNLSIFNAVSFSLTIHELSKYISDKFNIEIKFVDFNKKEYEFFLSDENLKNIGYKPKSSIDTLIDDISYNFNHLNYIKYKETDEINIWELLHECRVCKTKDLFEVIDLGLQSPPNRLSDKFYKFLKFPLKLNCCKECFHLQLGGYINPIILFSNYTYLSGVTNTMNAYFSDFVKSISDNNIHDNKKTILDNKKTVLDIACNDGCLLDYFKLNNYDTYGIDPAENLVNKIKDHKVICGFFSKNTVFEINNFDIITAFNVFAHLNDIYDFILNIDNISNENTSIFIQTSQCDMIINNEFDTIYHEHLSFFNLSSMIKFLSKTNFYLFDLKIVPVHGNSYLFHIKKKGIQNNVFNENIKNRLDYENKFDLFNINSYIKYKNNIELWVDNLILILKKYNTKIIGVGASAKGITILNYINKKLDDNNIIIDCIIDENNLKINKYINSVNLKINSFDYINEINQSAIFILFAWNFKHELISKISKNRKQYKDIFINLVPLEIL
jgi:2-polyprenyl-3-methyl-5-hydroxy-6-metoxy-1,4-benzoquinol methylase/nucleoside-diphosphate-sugar epimerase